MRVSSTVSYYRGVGARITTHSRLVILGTNRKVLFYEARSSHNEEILELECLKEN